MLDKIERPLFIKQNFRLFEGFVDQNSFQLKVYHLTSK